MSFELIETSVDEGRPVEMLLISFLTNSYAYTTSDQPVAHDGHIYSPLPISRTEITNTGDVSKASLTIKVPYDCVVGDLFRVQPPPGVVSVTLFTKHVDDPEVKVIWKGRIVNAEWELPWLSLTTENVFSSLKRIGLRRKYSTQCPFPVYSVGKGLCNVDRELFKVVAPVTSLSGVNVQCSSVSRAYNWFAGGFATWINSTTGYLERMMITSSGSIGDIVLTAQPRGLVVGQTMTMYPGCDHSSSTCHSKFNNSENCGCFEHIPRKNPFGGSTLY